MCGRYYIETEDTLSVQGAIRLAGFESGADCVLVLDLPASKPSSCGLARAAFNSPAGPKEFSECGPRSGQGLTTKPYWT